MRARGTWAVTAHPTRRTPGNNGVPATGPWRGRRGLGPSLLSPGRRQPAKPWREARRPVCPASRHSNSPAHRSKPPPPPVGPSGPLTPGGGGQASDTHSHSAPAAAQPGIPHLRQTFRPAGAPAGEWTGAARGHSGGGRAAPAGRRPAGEEARGAHNGAHVARAQCEATSRLLLKRLAENPVSRPTGAIQWELYNRRRAVLSARPPQASHSEAQPVEA